MFISKEKQILFFHNPKTAGTSLRDFLNKTCKDGNFFTHLFYEKYLNSQFKINSMLNVVDPTFNIYFNHLSQQELLVLNKEVNFNFENFVEIVVVRNPIDRLLSYYNFIMHKTYKNISMFLDDIEKQKVDPLLCFRSQLDYVSYPLSSKQIIFKYEEMDLLHDFLKSHFNNDGSLPKLNITKQKFVNKLETSLVDRCHRIFKEEFEVLGY
jgi:hypothetical protein